MRLANDHPEPSDRDAKATFRRWTPARAAALPKRIDRGEGAFAVSRAQARLWHDYQRRAAHAGAQAIYHSLQPIMFSGPLDAPALWVALDAVVARHESLRSRFVVKDGELVQVPKPPEPLPRVVSDLGRRDGESTDEAIGRRQDEFVARDFELATDQMLRAELVRIGPQEHMLLVIAHHIVSDGWSMDLLFDEIVRGYQFAAGHVTANLAVPDIQYADFVGWESRYEDRPDFRTALDYWTRQLGDPVPPLNLPTDRPRPASMTWRGARVGIELEPTTVQAARALARASGVSMFQLHLAVTLITLRHWTGQRDLVVGSPAVNRNLPQAEPLIGVFANLLPLRFMIDEDASFSDHLLQVRNGVLDAFEHQNVPFDELATRFGGAQGARSVPFVQAMLTCTTPTPRFEIDPSRAFAQRMSYEWEHTVHTDLAFSVLDGDARSELGVFFACELFDEATIRRLAESFAATLAEAVRYPGRALARLGVLGADERAMIECFEQGTAPRGCRTFGERFADVAAVHPDRPALVSGDRIVTYANLLQRAQAMATVLRSIAKDSGDLIGICLPRGEQRVVAVCAVLLADQAFLPIDPALPPPRVDYLLRDSGVRTVLGDAGTLESLQHESLLHRLDVARMTAAHDPRSATVEAPSADARSLAYVIYTSGSTGHPKGVEITQGGIANFVDWYVRAFELDPQDRCLQLASPNFDASILDSLPALACGASLYIADDTWRQDPMLLWERMSGAGITVAFLTTPLFNAAVGACDESAVGALRCVQVGGDRLLPLTGALPFALHDLYGPTEVTIAVTAGRIEPGTKQHIGGPIDGMNVRVLDERLRRVPVGVVGELFAAGVGLARGYRGRAGLSAARFIADPYAEDAGRRLYRTGDRVRWTPGGQLEYLGRADDQVKVLGHRVELTEIEAALVANPAVAEALVATYTRGDATIGLTAYVRLLHECDDNALRGWLSERLPAWMVPARFVHMDRFPLTINGKVDRSALPAVTPDAARTRVAPEGPIQELVAELWSELLQVPDVSADDDFFALGGHSLLVSRLQARIAQRTGCEISFALIFDRPALSSFANAIEEMILSMLEQA